MKTPLKALAVAVLLFVALPQSGHSGICGSAKYCSGDIMWVPCPEGFPPELACHGVCDNTLNPCTEDAPELYAAIAAGDARRVLRSSSLYPQLVRFNPSRSAIQVLSCAGGTVAASFPVSAEMAVVARTTLLLMPANPQAYVAVGLRLNRAPALRASIGPQASLVTAAMPTEGHGLQSLARITMQ